MKIYEKVRQLTDIEAAMLIDCIKKPDKLERAKTIIDESGNEEFKGVGDVTIRISGADLYALYKYTQGDKTIYYVPVIVIDSELAICVSVY